MSLSALLLVAAVLGGQDELELPALRSAVEDRVPPGEFRPVLEIRRDGRIGVEGESLYAPEVDDGKEEPLGRVRAWLVATADRMKKGRADGRNVPDDALLIRADRRAPFHAVRRVLELCIEPDILVWKVQLAGRAPGGSSGRVAIHLPDWYLPPVGSVSEAREVAEVRIHVLAGGEGEERRSFYSLGSFFVAEDLEKLGDGLARLWRVRAELGEGPTPLSIDAGALTTCEEVAAVLDVVLEAGLFEVEFFSWEFPPDLPAVRHAVEDRLAPGEFRPVLEISEHGWIGAEGQWLHVPAIDDASEEPFERVRSWLAETARRMSRDHLNEVDGVGPMVPDDALLIRPESRTPFRSLQAVMEICGEYPILIWRIQLAARTTSGAEGRLAAHLSKRIGIADVTIERIEVRIECGEDGALQYSVGPFVTKDLAALGRRLANLHRHHVPEDGVLLEVTVDPRPGTLYRDVTAVLDEILDAGFTEFLIVGAY